MAAQRPVVLVFQEFATAAVTAAVPDLNSLIVGPAYHIRDYPADAASILIGEYHDKSVASDPNGLPTGIPLSGQDVITVADPPDNVVGAVLDASSVELWLDEVLVRVATGNSGNADETTAPDENEFTDASATFETAGVLPGDRLVATLADGTTVEKIVQSVTSETALRVSSNFTAAGTDINGNAFSGKTWDTASVRWRIERELPDAIEVSNSFYEIAGNVVTLKGAITTLVDVDGDGVDETVVVHHGNAYLGYRALRQDLATVKDIEDPATIPSVIGRLDERNPLAVGVSVALQNTITPIKYFGVTGDDLNGNSDRLAAYNAALSAIEPLTDIYAICPLANELSVVSAVRVHAEGLADPEKGNFRICVGSSAGLPGTKVVAPASVTGVTEQVDGDAVNVVAFDAGGTLETDGVAAGDTFVLLDVTPGARDASYIISEVYDEDRLRTTSAVAAASTASANYYVLAGTQGVVDEVVTLGDASYEESTASTITFATRTCTADDVGKVLRILNPSGANDDQSPIGNDDYLITGFTASTLEILGDLDSDQANLNVQIIDTVSSNVAPAGVAVTSRSPFRRLLDPGATFVSDGIIASDLLEIPLPATSEGADFTDVLFQGVISSVISENRVLLAAGTDIPTTDVASEQSDVGYRVSRVLDKASQVDEIVAVVESIASKRVTMVWPDSVLVSGVQNAKTGVQSAQPGFYLACAVAGMSAGLPPHQGFTNLSIAGIDQINNSTGYFSESQLTEISNAGWFLFVQENANSAPYVLHQLTTDVSTTENGELSIVRNFDYVSLFYKDILDDFLGKYNVINQTLDLIREALNAGTTQLLSQVLPRIGAPLTSAEVSKISVLDGTKDRVEVFMDIGLPTPLNRIGLHLIA